MNAPPIPQHVGPCQFGRRGSWITVQCPAEFDPMMLTGRRRVGSGRTSLVVSATSPRRGAARATTAVRGRPMNEPGAPSLQRYPSTADTELPTPGAWCSCCWGTRWWRGAARPTAGAAGGAIRRTTSSPIRCAGSRRRSRPGRCCRRRVAPGFLPVSANLPAPLCSAVLAAYMR